MTSRDFCYWLQGFFELTETGPLSLVQCAVIKNHLALVFKHEIDPSIDKGDAAKKAELDALHHSTNPIPPRMRC